MRTKNIATDVIFVCGLCVLVIGIDMISRPAAIIVSGLALCGFALLLGLIPRRSS